MANEDEATIMWAHDMFMLGVSTCYMMLYMQQGITPSLHAMVLASIHRDVMEFMEVRRDG
jgi:hypothetical protein